MKEHNGKEMRGQKFGRLTVRALGKKKKCYGNALVWICDCDCGGTTEVPGIALRNGRRTSCGCVFREPRCKGWKGHGDISGVYWRRVLNRIKDGYEVTISIEDAWEIFKQQAGRCALTGLPLSFVLTAKNRQNQTASLDRIDSSIGYVKGNIQWVHKIVNIMKGKLNEQEFVNLCSLIARYSLSKKDVINDYVI